MKKIYTLLLSLALTIGASAQEQGFYGNRFFDNWYIGVNGGLSSKTTRQPVFKNLNASAALRLGKKLTPVFGVGFEGAAFFNNRANGQANSKGAVVRYSQVGAFFDINLSNAIGGFYGEPRKFEVAFVPGFFWGHTYGEYTWNTKKNTLVNRLAVNLAYNFGNDRQWQLYAEPSYNFIVAGMREPGYKLDGNGKRLVGYNSLYTFMQLSIGINYKFMTSNGTHNFAIVEECDQMEQDALNDQINELREKAERDEETLIALQKEEQELKQAYRECEEKPVPVVKKEVSKEPSLPAIFYPVNKFVIQPSQMQSVAIAAEVMKNHPEYTLLIKGYASPEGPHDNNNVLGVKRAEAVKTMLVNKYKIAASRITAEGCGETDELFPVFEFNRVAMLTLKKNEK